jgi:hypothetical protein
MVIEMTQNEEIRLKFDLEVDEGFPPISSELLIAKRINESFIIDNTPFFVENVAYGDEFTVIEIDGIYVPKTILCQSNNSAISIIFFDDSIKNELYVIFLKLGCWSEYGEFPEYNMLAVCVPENVSYAPIRKMLDEYENASKISYAELSLSHDR